MSASAAGGTVGAIAERICARVLALPETGRRRLIAVAGPPAAGKSTVSEAVVARLNAAGRPAGLVAMDGFHFDNAVLEPRGLLARKGAPETFDLAGFSALLHRLQREAEVAVPVFDRTLDKAIAGAALVRADQQDVVVEGNYLLLDAPGWRDLHALWALSVFLMVGEAELEARLIDRWRTHGLGPEAARHRAEANDLPNARQVMAHRQPADLELAQSRPA